MLKGFALPLFILIPSLANAQEFTLQAGGEEMCSGFLHQLNHQMGFTKEKPKEVTTVKRTYPDGKVKLPLEIQETPMIFDFDNDGIKDLVAEFNDDRRYINGSIFYVAYGKGIANISQIDVTDLNVFPCQFAVNKPDASDCPTFSQKADGAGIDFKLEGAEVHFRGRYTDVNVRTYKSENYLQLIRTDKYPYSKHYAGIIKVKNQVEFTPVCLFSKY